MSLFAVGCSYNFDSAGPEIPLVGKPIEPVAFPKLNPDGVPVSDVYVRLGVGNAPWAVLIAAPVVQLPPVVGKQPSVAYLVPLAGTGTPQVVTADQIVIGTRQLYLVYAAATDGGPLKLVLRQPGDDGIGRQLMMPPGGATIVPSQYDEAFAYIAVSEMTNSILLIRSDGSFQRELPLPDGVNGSNLIDNVRLFFDDRGDHLISQDPDGNLVSHATTAESDLPLGKADASLLWSSRNPSVIACGPNGLVRVPIDGSARTMLDATPCQPDVLVLALQKVYYMRDGALYTVPELGGTPQPIATSSLAQLLGIGPDGSVIYSKDPSLLYGAGIGDGWIGNTQYMTRGRRPTWSSDGRRLRWLESAARSDGSGELVSALLPAPTSTLLAHNVRQFQELTPSRTLAISNSAGRGVYNRLILIDEDAQQAYWVVDSARAFATIPGSTDVLASIVNGQIGYDIRRVPVPQ